MNEQVFSRICKQLVSKYTDERVQPEDVYVVWQCKTLQNNKALLSTPLPDGMYYECTYSGDKKELYFDAYRKQENICYSVEEETIVEVSNNG